MATERKYEVPAGDEIEYAEGYQARVDEGFTALQDHFGEWIAEKCEPAFKTAKELEAFKLGAKAALWLRMYHQRSPENHAFKEELRNSRSEESDAKAAAREEKIAAREAAAEEKAAAKQAAAEERAARKAAKEGATEAPAAKPARGRAAATKATAAPAAKATAAKPTRGATKAPAAAAKPARRPAANGAARPARRAKAEAEF